jgi:hypothetical protein
MCYVCHGKEEKWNFRFLGRDFLLCEKCAVFTFLYGLSYFSPLLKLGFYKIIGIAFADTVMGFYKKYLWPFFEKRKGNTCDECGRECYTGMALKGGKQFCLNCVGSPPPILKDETETVLYREYKNQPKRLASAIQRHRDNRRRLEKRYGIKK